MERYFANKVVQIYSKQHTEFFSLSTERLNKQGRSRDVLWKIIQFITVNRANNVYNMMNSWVTNGLGEGRRSFSEVQKVKNRSLYREEAIRGKSSINGQITYFNQTSEDCLCGNFEGNSFSLQDVSMGRQKQRNKEEQQGCIRKHGHFNSKYNYRTPLISLYPSVAMETESSGLFAGIEEHNYLEETNRVLRDLVNIRVKKQTERLGGYLKTNSETKGERAIRKGRKNNTTLPGIVERHGIRKSFDSDSWRPETNLMPNSNVTVKLSLVLAIVVGVASALAAAFLAVVCKCCWVWWRYRRAQRRDSGPSKETFIINQKNKWPAGMTYKTYENGSVADYDSISSGEEPYIVETPADFGKLQFWVEHNRAENALIVGLVQAKGIICKTNVQTSYVYPVVQLCEGDKSLEEREIERQRMRFEPQWNEEVLFSLEERSLESLSLRIRLVEVDSFSESHLIGQVVLSLQEAEMDEPQPKWYDIDDGQKTPTHEYVGELLLSLNYFPTTQRLTIVVLKARNLKIQSTSGLWGPTVRVFLFMKQNRLSKKRTAMQKKTLDPVYNEAFTFKVTSDALPKVMFKVFIVNKHSHGADQTIGHVLLGQHVTGSGFSHWNHMLASLRKPIAMWHPIVPSA